MMNTQQPIPVSERSATETNVSEQDTHRRLAILTRDRVSIELSTLDVCFLAALQLRADTDALASFEEDLVLDVFDQVCDLVEPGIENRRQRASYTIQRLRSQRMLARVDAMGIISAGEFALTSLGAMIVRSFLEDERLTRESLALLTGAVISSLAQIRTSAQRASGEAEWVAQVVAPLRVTVGELVGGIERRQRGLDAQQEEVRDQIGELLQADWFGAVEQCQTLLEATASTLHELNEVLLRDSSQIQSLLQEVQQAAVAARAEQAEEAAQRVAEQVDRMAAWGGSRQQAWSDHYQYVHRYLRDVVRLDPERALSQRLLEQIRAWPARPFSVVVADDARIRLLRPVSARKQRPPVGRPHEDREPEMALVASEEHDADLEALVREALDCGADLSTVTRRVVHRLEEGGRYVAMGRIAAIVARLRAPQIAHERPWVRVTPSIEIEDWSLDRHEEEGR
jgi:chromosome partition protein MukF